MNRRQLCDFVTWLVPSSCKLQLHTYLHRSASEFFRHVIFTRLYTKASTGAVPVGRVEAASIFLNGLAGSRSGRPGGDVKEQRHRAPPSHVFSHWGQPVGRPWRLVTLLTLGTPQHRDARAGRRGQHPGTARRRRPARGSDSED
jgi:hypothetical protein